MSREQDFVERRFLNQGNYHSTAAVVAKIEKSDYSEYKYVEFIISDCSRNISLEMDSETIKDLENSIFKMQQLIDVAEIMKVKLEELKPEVEKREKRKLAKEKAKKLKDKAEKLAQEIKE